jgi:hypothetical protein
VPFDESAQKMRVCKYEVVGFASGYPMSSTVSDNSDLPNSCEDEDADGEEEDDEDDEVDEDEDLDCSPDPDRDGDDYRGSYHAPPEGFLGKPLTILGLDGAIRKAALDKKDAKALMQSSIEDLRRYAGKLDIVGASKIPGGKTALVTKILRARRRH